MPAHTITAAFARSILIQRDIEASLGGSAHYAVCQPDGPKKGTQVAITLPPHTAAQLMNALPEFVALFDIWVNHGTPYIKKPRNCLQLVFKDVSEADYPLIKMALTTYYMTSDQFLLQKIAILADENDNHDVIATYALTKCAEDALRGASFEDTGRLLSGDY